MAAPAADAEALLAHVLGFERAHLHAEPESAVRDEDAARFRDLVARRAARVPLQHLTGVQEFWSLRFQVGPAVLIPRPESELLIEAFLRLNRRPDPIVVDVGTGSGCLAIAVAHETPGALVHATDVSEEALMVARLNAASLDVAGRIAFYRGDLLEPLGGLGLEGQVDFILSNPPYIGEGELASLEPVPSGAHRRHEEGGRSGHGRAPARRGGLYERRGRDPGHDRPRAGHGRANPGGSAMKLIVAIVRPEKLNDVLEALYKEEVRGLTITLARGHGGELESVETYRGTTVKMALVDKVRLDIGVSEPFVERTVQAIMRSGRTGEVGDGKIFVLPVQKVYRIRTGEEDVEAVTPLA